MQLTQSPVLFEELTPQEAHATQGGHCYYPISYRYVPTYRCYNPCPSRTYQPPSGVNQDVNINFVVD